MNSKNLSLYSLILLCSISLSLKSQQFTSVTIGDIVNTESGSRSCNFIDFNNDNHEDIFITNGTSGGENNMLYINNGDDTFTLVDEIVNEDDSPSDGATCADYDNDGYIDIYAVNWYNEDNLLYNNSADGFNQVDTGDVFLSAGYSETASWGDANNDGFVDLYVTNSAGNKKNYLFKNHGNGYFEKIQGMDIVTDPYFSRCVNWIDYDNDGDADVFVTNEGNQANNLYRNDGDFVFTKITEGDLVTDLKKSMSASWEDIDNDGDMDVFVANYQQSNQLYINDGEGNFTTVSGPWDDESGCSFGSSFSDYDNDGDLDLFITNGFCSDDLNNYLYRNDGNAIFTKIEDEVMAMDTGGSYGCAWGDYNNDGQVDLVVANWQDETQNNYLYKNEGNDNSWLKFSLQGDESNYSAIGTIVKVKASINGEDIWQTRHVSAQSGYCSQNSLKVHLGLGDASEVDSVIIQWPSGIEQVFENLAVNSFYSVIEENEIQTLGLNSDLNIRDIKIAAYPNPSNGSFKIEINNCEGEIVELSISNISGRVFHSSKLRISNSRHTLTNSEIDSLPKGYYIINIKNKEIEKSLTLIVQ